MNPVSITHVLCWDAVGYSLDGEPTKELRQAPPFQDIHPRARRPDPASMIFVQAAHLLLSRTNPDLESTGLIIASEEGSRATDDAFLTTLAERGRAFGSPSLFVYTLSTSPLAEASLALKLRGEVMALSSKSGAESLLAAHDRVASGALSACIAGKAELGTRGDLLMLFLLENVAIPSRQLKVSPETSHHKTPSDLRGLFEAWTRIEPWECSTEGVRLQLR
jgi:3-oxoacyl-(acyl-carrier-protein) synthase